MDWRRDIGRGLRLFVLLGLGALVGYAIGSPRAAEPPRPAVVPGPAEFTAGSPRVAELRAAARDANVVICVLDAARADHIGCYGYPRETTPNIDRLARESLVFENHFCQLPTTRPSTYSLFTSQYPDTHLVYGPRTVYPWTFTMAEGLKASEFRTVLFSNNVYCSPAMGLGTDFDETHYVTDIPRLMTRGPQTLLDKISSWLEEGRESRFFAYVHFLQPHFPYNAPEEMKALFAGQQPPGFERGDVAMVNEYDANLLYADWAVGELEGLLREAGVLDDTVFIVTADHGEAFGEHGHKWHESCPYDEAIRIPILMRLPGARRTAARITALTQVIDLMPTLFDLFEIPYPEQGMQGKSLLPMLAGEVDGVNDYAFSRTVGDNPCYVVRDHRWALLLYQGGEKRELYDMEADPRQTRNIIEQEPGRAAELAAAFRAFAVEQRSPPLDFVDPDAEVRGRPGAPEIEVDEETIRQLKALGYLR